MITARDGKDSFRHASRVALVSGTSTFKEGFSPLLRVPDELRMMKAVLVESAGCAIHRDSQLDPTVDQLLRSFERALEGDDGTPPDLLVFYYSGHAEELGDGDLVLAAHNSERRWRSSHLRVDDLFAMLIAKNRQRPREVVILLDTCHSGLAVTRFEQAQANERAKGTALPVFTAIGSIDRLRKAHQLHFADSFAAAVRTAPGSEKEEFMPIDVLFDALVRRMRDLPGDDGRPPEPEYLPPRSKSRAFFNPWYLPQRIRRPQEANGASGWAFSGRAKAVDEAISYLTGDQAGALAVIGSAGSGKSVLLDWIHTTAHADPLPAGPRAPEPAPLGCLDLLLDARGMTVESVIQRLASHYGTGTERGDAQALVDDLAARPQTLSICFDSIDACTDPDSLYASLLAPLATLEQARIVLAGTQAPPGFTGPRIDLDHPEFFDANDITVFVEHVLWHRKGTTWTHVDPDLVTEIARATAGAAGLSWLRAYLFAVSLSSEDPATARVRAERTTAELFLDQMRALDEDDPQWALDLLLPVALAQGEGLPTDGQLWAAVVSEASGRDVGAADLEQVSQRASDFLAAPESGVHGHGWRFERSPNADFLVQAAGEVPSHAAFVRAMTERLPLRSSGTRDWTAADRYTREYFAYHAQLAGVLADYIDDPEFLLMNSDALRRVLTVLHDSPFGHIARVRSLCGELARTDRTDGHTLSRMALLAQVYELPELARRAGESAAGWQPTLTYRRPVMAVYCLPDGGQLVVDEEAAILSKFASPDGHAWKTLTPRHRTAGITATSVIDVSGPALFAGQINGQAWVERLADGASFQVPGLTLDCRVVACVQLKSRGLLIAGTEGWQWRADQVTGPLVPRGRLRIGGAATAVSNNVPLVAAHTAKDVSVWRADGQLLHAYEPPQKLALTAIAADGDGIYTGAGDGSVWLTSWDGAASRKITAHISQVAELRVHTIGSHRVLVSAGQQGDIDLTPLTPRSGAYFHAELGCHVSSVDVDAGGHLVVGTSAGVVHIAH
ncbi:caspase family protein [Nocardia gamkensis]|uniref:caspase family protein n=1 Tax=Nocardia gamkensis TaxID=352869 RepID=UPI0036EE6111